MKLESISIDKEVLGGTPIFLGTSAPAQSVFDWQETETLKEFLKNFPSVGRSKATA